MHHLMMHRSSKVTTLQEGPGSSVRHRNETAEAKARLDKLLTSMTVEKRRDVMEQIADDDQALKEKLEDMMDSYGTLMNASESRRKCFSWNAHGLLYG